MQLVRDFVVVFVVALALLLIVNPLGAHRKGESFSHDAKVLITP